MFASRYFSSNYFAPRYFPRRGVVAAPITDDTIIFDLYVSQTQSALLNVKKMAVIHVYINQAQAALSTVKKTAEFDAYIDRERRTTLER